MYIYAVHWKDWCWGWISSTLATSCEELTHWKRPWCWEGLGAGGEGDDRGWDDWMASPTRCTWVWVNSGSWWWTGRPGVLGFMGSQRAGHNWGTKLDWTELKLWTLGNNVGTSIVTNVALLRCRCWQWGRQGIYGDSVLCTQFCCDYKTTSKKWSVLKTQQWAVPDCVLGKWNGISSLCFWYSGLVGKPSPKVRHPIRSQRSHSAFPRDFICPVSLPFHLVPHSLHLSSFPWIIMSLTSSEVSTRRDGIRKLGEPKMFKSLFPPFRSRLWRLIGYNMVVHTCEVNFFRHCHLHNSDWWNWFCNSRRKTLVFLLNYLYNCLCSLLPFLDRCGKFGER